MAYVNYDVQPWKKSTWVDDGQVSSSEAPQRSGTSWGEAKWVDDGKYGSQRSGTSWGEAKGGEEYTGKHGSQPSGSSWGNAKGGIIGGIKGAKGGISGKKKKV